MVNEGIRVILNLFAFLWENFTHTKSTKMQKYKNSFIYVFVIFMLFELFMLFVLFMRIKNI